MQSFLVKSIPLSAKFGAHPDRLKIQEMRASEGEESVHEGRICQSQRRHNGIHWVRIITRRGQHSRHDMREVIKQSPMES